MHMNDTRSIGDGGLEVLFGGGITACHTGAYARIQNQFFFFCHTSHCLFLNQFNC
eukprot:07005.XXX_153964_154128_1 [CDS] Oithona nana genome sequencing.